MKASVGDRVVVVSSKVGGTVRDGRVVELRHADGSPPYVVEWSDTGQTGLYFPGPDGFVDHEPASGTAAPSPSTPAHVKTWRVEVQLFEHGSETTARAVLHAESPMGIEARGSAHRADGDLDVPEIGDEVAAARALRHLADRLLGTASEDLTDMEGRRVELTR